MRKPRLKIGLLALPLMLAVFANASQPPAPSLIKTPTNNTPTTETKVSAGPVLNGIGSYTLSNGLQLFLIPDDSKPNTTVMVDYFVGSRDELYGESGSAHLLEHMLFLGTPKVPTPRDEFRRRGMGQNATTSSDRTLYYENFSANDDNLEWALMMEADRMTHASVTPASLAKEMTVVRNELERGENSPSNLLYQRLLASAYRYNKFREPTIGNRSDVENVNLDRLRSLYQRYYRPDNAAVAIVGSFDKTKALAWVQQYLGAIAKPATPIERRRSVEPAQDGERSVTLRKSGELPLLMLGYHVPSSPHPDNLALSVLRYLISNAVDGRIQKLLVERKLALGGSASSTDSQGEPGLFTVTLVLPKAADLPAMETTLQKLIEQDLMTSIKDEEIERAKAAYASSIHNALNNPSTLASIALSSAQHGDWRLGFYEIDQLEKVSAADVRRVASTYLLAANRTTGRFIPTDASSKVDIPAAPDLSADLKQYQGHNIITEGEKFEPTVANIASRTLTGQLSNGLKYALLPRKLRGEKVYARLTLRFGDEKTTFGLATSGADLNDVFGKATQYRDRVALASEFNKLKSSATFTAFEQGLSASLNSERTQFDAALKEFRDWLREPVFNQSDVDIKKNRQLESLAATEKTTDPATLASRKLSDYFAADFPRGDLRHHNSLKEQREDVERTSLDGMKRFYQDFYGVNEGEMIIVGDFDPAATITKLEALFGDWAKTKPFHHASVPFRDVPPAYFSTQTDDKANAIYLARANHPVGELHADRLAMSVANSLLGSGDKSRLFQRIRTQEGLSYGVYSSVNFDRKDGWGTWQINATYAPENRAKVEHLVKEEIEKVRKDGFTQQELDDLKSGWLRNMRSALASESNQIDMLYDLLRYNDPLRKEEDEITALEKLTLTEVNRVFRQYFDPAKLSVSVAGNFAKAASVGNTAKSEMTKQ